MHSYSSSSSSCWGSCRQILGNTQLKRNMTLTKELSSETLKRIMKLGWLVVLFYSISTLFGSFNADSSHFDKNFVLVLFCLVWFCGISIIISYSMPNPFLYILTVLFQTIQFSISIQFKCQKQFDLKLFTFVNKINCYLSLTIQLNIS